MVWTACYELPHLIHCWSYLYCCIVTVDPISPVVWAPKALSLSCVIVSPALHAAPRYISHQQKFLIFFFHVWLGGENNAAFLKHHKDKSDVDLTFQPSPKVANDAKQKRERERQLELGRAAVYKQASLASDTVSGEYNSPFVPLVSSPGTSYSFWELACW